MSYLTGYLRLNDRMSQIWLNIYTLTLLLVMLKLLFFTKSIKDSINFAKSYTLSHCNDIDSLYANGLSDTPHYLGIMGNFLIEKTMIESVQATLKVFSMLVYACEELLTFIVDLYIGTYVCLIVSAIDSTVDVATNTTEALIKLVNSSIVNFSEELDDSLTDISEILDKIITAASKIESVFDDDDDSDDASDTISKINITISSLRNFTIPSSINTKLQELSKKTPDFTEVKNMTKSLISVPFEKVRNEIGSINSTTIVGDPNLLYVPPLNGNNSVASNASGICSSNELNIEKIFNSFEKTLQIVTVTFIVLITLAALAAMLPAVWKEYRLWKRLDAMRDQYLEVHADVVKGSIEKSNCINPFESREEREPYDVIASYHQCFHRWSGRISNFIVRMLTSVSKRQLNDHTKIKIQWVVSYMISERALLLLGVGILALLTSICQFFIIAVCRSFLDDKNNVSLTSLSNSSTILTSLRNEMAQWAQETNLYIASTEQNMNSRAFGWINDTTISVNSTANKMMAEIATTTQDAFNDTILYSPMTAVIACVIGNKLTAVEEAMTWINDKVRFQLPRIDPSQIQALLAGSQNSSNVTAVLTSATVATVMETMAEDIRAALLQVLTGFYKTTLYELIVALIVIALWVMQLPIALAILHYRTRRFAHQVA